MKQIFENQWGQAYEILSNVMFRINNSQFMNQRQLVECENSNGMFFAV